MTYIFYNGQYIKDDQPALSCYDRGFLLGDGIFETLKYQAGQLELFAEHYARFKRSADFFYLDLSYTSEALALICQELVARNHLQQKEVALRITLTRGKSQRGIDIPPVSAPSLLISAVHYKINHRDPLRLYPVNIVRSSQAITSQHKTINYLESIMAREQAKKQGFDDGLLLNERGEIVCSSVANIFFVKNNKIITPRLDCGALPGIMRSQMLQRKNITEAVIKLADLAGCSGAFITNSLFGRREVCAIGAVTFDVV